MSAFFLCLIHCSISDLYRFSPLSLNNCVIHHRLIKLPTIELVFHDFTKKMFDIFLVNRNMCLRKTVRWPRGRRRSPAKGVCGL